MAVIPSVFTRAILLSCLNPDIGKSLQITLLIHLFIQFNGWYKVFFKDFKGRSFCKIITTGKCNNSV